jgi:hypothetical protein
MTETVSSPSSSRFGIFRRDYSALFQRADQDRVHEDLRTFFGPRAEKYLAIYEKMRARNSSNHASWNWVVFLTNFPWFFYRKMYITGSLLILAPIVAAYLVGIGGQAGISAAVAVSANSLYVTAAMRRLEKADALGLFGERRQDYLKRAGGVSVVAGTLSGILCAAVVGLAILGAVIEHRKSVH